MVLRYPVTAELSFPLNTSQRIMTGLVTLSLGLVLMSCSEPRRGDGEANQRGDAALGSPEHRAKQASPATGQSSSYQPKRELERTSESVATTRKRSGPQVKWEADIDWTSLEIATDPSRNRGQPSLVMVYADWCSKCRSWGEALEDPVLTELAQKLNMVKLNQDEGGPDMARFRSQGSYVPRFVFLTSQGEVNETLKSGHPRYPYFYSAKRPVALMSRMKRALGL